MCLTVDIGYMSLSTTTLFDSIDITTEPTKTSYTYGDDLDLSGMVVKHTIRTIPQNYYRLHCKRL